mmetsp:Transcript_15614/g.44208  ORF Transcript_15614/g.44208 Transcript_15614/m.44208 type:complete len:260 (+) Transcript_15614:41-820(+)
MVRTRTHIVAYLAMRTHHDKYVCVHASRAWQPARVSSRPKSPQHEVKLAVASAQADTVHQKLPLELSLIRTRVWRSTAFVDIVQLDASGHLSVKWRSRAAWVACGFAAASIVHVVAGKVSHTATPFNRVPARVICATASLGFVAACFSLGGLPGGGFLCGLAVAGAFVVIVATRLSARDFVRECRSWQGYTAREAHMELRVDEKGRLPIALQHAVHARQQARHPAAPALHHDGSELARAVLALKDAPAVAARAERPLAV